MKRKPPATGNQAIGLLVLVAACNLTTAGELRAKTPNRHDPPPMITLTSYLLLDGNCQAAMEFYHSCLGGELILTLVGNSPMKAAFPAALHQKVVNALLVSGSISLSASDWLRPRQTPVQGNTVCLYLSGGSATELQAIFAKLAAGADVTDPIRDEPFGTYGALNDKFGVRWMFHAARRD